MKGLLFLSQILTGLCFFFEEESNLRTLWEQWKLQHQKDYEDESLEAYRFQVFVSNYRIIQEWNLNPENTATLALNQFSDLTQEEFGSLFRSSLSDIELPLHNEENIDNQINIKDIPDSWDWRDHGAVLPVTLTQGQCASDWALATTASLEALYFIEGHPLTALSPQQLIDCMTAGCSGGFAATAIQYVAKNGIEALADYPFTGTPGKCQYSADKALKITSGVGTVPPKNVTALRAAIYQQPTLVMIEADQAAFQFYTDGVISSGCGALVNHVVTAVGYGAYQGQESFTIRNTWGPNFGLKGYVYISANTTINNGLGACGIFTSPIYPQKI